MKKFYIIYEISLKQILVASTDYYRPDKPDVEEITVLKPLNYLGKFLSIEDAETEINNNFETGKQYTILPAYEKN